ncbi:oocyte zinc finger protein XlCOF7.1-like [Pelobates fuscus]|uniref:oocyte zinc finger protein XlCOF7.1-like n=1 Tax=Pelobates fuscus TaxID=191477 RepID=UPI002FE46B71
MDKDKKQKTEKILDLTLEIIYLLTGEDCVVVKKPGDNVMWSSILCVLERSYKTQPHSTVPSHDKNYDQKILDLSNQIIHLLTGEVPIRCEDVTVYFSVEEWEYLEGHQDFYKDMLMENHKLVHSLGDIKEDKSGLCRNTTQKTLENSAQNDTTQKRQSNTNAEVSALYGEGNLTDIYRPTEHTQIEHPFTHMKEEPALSEKENVTDTIIYTPTDCTQTEYSFTYIKKEPTSTEQENLKNIDNNTPTEHEESVYKATRINEKLVMCGEEGFRHDHNYTDTECTFSWPEHANSISHMSNHTLYQRILTGEQQFQCFICGKYFKLKNSLIKCGKNPSGKIIIKCIECASSEEGTLRNSDIYTPTEHTQTEYPSTHIKGEPVPSEESKLNEKDISIPTEYSQTEYRSSSCEEGNIIDNDVYTPTEHTQASYIWMVKKDGLMKTFNSITAKQVSEYHSRCNNDSANQQTTRITNKLYTCSECQKCFTNNIEFIKHQRSHTAEKPFSCSQCGKCFTHKSSFVKHQWIHMGKKQFSCSDCDKSFVCSSYLAKHQKIHSSDKPFSCSECGRCFRRSSQLVMHERTHTGEKPFSCSECGKCFAVKSNLVTHQKIHSGIKPYTCPKCGKCFNCKASLVIHQDIHSEKKLYTCSECGKSFAQKSTLFRHKNIHTERKSFPCSVCGKCFTQKSSLNLHQRIHTGEKPFSCSECGKSFTNRPDLVKHEMIHTGKNPFPCSECGVCFNHKSSLTKHQKIHTGEKLQRISKITETTKTHDMGFKFGLT